MGDSLTVAVAGVTGAVGQEFVRLLETKPWATTVKFLASARSAGKSLSFRGQTHSIDELTEDSLRGVDIALFSAGSKVSRQFGPICRQLQCLMIDNSSAFRMTAGVPLVVPEVNPDAALQHEYIIANPNCSTIIMNVPVWPLHRAFGVSRAVVSTYQAVSGAGAQAMAELERQTADVLAGRQPTPSIFPFPIAFNVFSHNSTIGPDGYNEEETKMLKETRKIFGDPGFRVTATCIRVPVLRSHCESINLEFSRPVREQDLRDILAKAPGVRVVDDRAGNHFPMPIETSGGSDVLVGRIRADRSLPDGLGFNLFVCGDQLLKGAAQNAMQIADLVVNKLAMTR